MRKLSKILALVLVLMMAFAVVSAFNFTTSAAETTTTQATKIFLKPSSNWKQSSARFAARFWTDTPSFKETWVSMTDADKDGIYECVVPTGMDKVIICRMNPSATANNWDNKWNQTGDLKVPTTDKVLFTIASSTWDGQTSGWGKLCSSHTLVQDDENTFESTCTTNMAVDKHGRDVFLADTSYALAIAQDNFKDINFKFTSEV